MAIQSLDPGILNHVIRSVCPSNDRLSWFVGCYSGDIYQIKVSESQTDARLQHKLISSHYTPNFQWTNELWGLAPIPDSDTFVTCSDDGTLRLWSNSKRR